MLTYGIIQLVFPMWLIEDELQKKIITLQLFYNYNKAFQIYTYYKWFNSNGNVSLYWVM